MVRNVLFDFAGTLADLKPHSETMLCNYAKETYNLDLEESVVKEAFSCMDRQLFYSSVKITDFEDKSKFYKQYNDRILQHLALSDLIDNSDNQLFHYFSSQKRHWVLKEDVIPTLEILKHKGLKIGIISNFDSKLLELVENLQIHHLIDYLHISQDEGYEKPQLEFYQSFFGRHLLDPAESLYCGDSYVLDFLPAKALGLKALIIDPDRKYPKRAEIIVNISDILGHLEMT